MAFCFNFSKLPRCGAKARSNNNQPCRQAGTLANGRCHWHGGSNKCKHGLYTKQSEKARSEQRVLINEMKQITCSLKEMINA